MKHNLFNIISSDFFKLLTSIYKEKFVECILLIYEMYKTDEIIKQFFQYNASIVSNSYKFLLSSGIKTESKINAILKNLNTLDVNSIFSIFTQNYISEESLRTIPIHKTLDEMKNLDASVEVSRKSSLVSEI